MEESRKGKEGRKKRNYDGREWKGKRRKEKEKREGRKKKQGENGKETKGKRERKEKTEGAQFEGEKNNNNKATTI